VRTHPLIFVLTMFLVLSTSCMRTVKMGDPALKPFASMYAVDRAAYGFTPLPTNGPVSIEGKDHFGGGYDAMLHFGGNPSRTIAFRWDGKTYQWLGEQEVFDGPRLWKTASGAQEHEEISITFYKEAVDGEFKGLTIDYTGSDDKLTMPRPERENWSLTLAEVNPFLEQWGFRR
jgi:hypothetical protein